MAAKTSRPQASGFLGLGLTTLSVDPRLAARCRRELETMAPRLSELSRSTCNPLSRHLWLRYHPRKSRHIEAGRVERVYHGTSEDAVPRPKAKPRCLFEAKKIMKQGFKASTDGLLGAGVYVTTDRSSWDASRTGHSVPR